MVLHKDNYPLHAWIALYHIYIVIRRYLEYEVKWSLTSGPLRPRHGNDGNFPFMPIECPSSIKGHLEDDVKWSLPSEHYESS